MFFGKSQLLSFKENDNKRVTEEEIISGLNTKTHLVLIHEKIKPVADDKKYDLIFLPSPNDVCIGEWYLLYDNRVYWIQGLKLNSNSVSSFINDNVVNIDCILGTFEFDVIFIFISIMYTSPQKYLTMSSRIIDCYRNNNTSEFSAKLEQGVLFLWNNNISDIRNRVSYLCDVADVNSTCATGDVLYKPNGTKLLSMLKYKVEKMCKFIEDNSVLISDYCNEDIATVGDNTRKHSINFNSDKCKLFCWLILQSYLSTASKDAILPLSITKQIDAFNSSINTANINNKTEPTAPLICVRRCAKKPKTKPPPRGVSSIKSFFKQIM